MADNVGTVASIYEAFGRGDVAWILDQLDPDVTWEDGIRANAIPYLQPRRGKDQIPQFFADLASTAVLTHFEPVLFADGGDAVLALITHAGHIIDGGDVPMTDEVHVWQFGPDGKVIAMRHMLDIAIHEAAYAQRTAANTGSTILIGEEVLTCLKGGGEFEVFELTGAQDAGPPPHAHPWAESFYGIAGQTEIVVDDVTHVVNAGDFVSVAAGQMHTYRLLSAESKVVVVTSGARASAFFTDLATAVGPGAPTPETLPAMFDVARRHGLTSPLFG